MDKKSKNAMQSMAAELVNIQPMNSDIFSLNNHAIYPHQVIFNKPIKFTELAIFMIDNGIAFDSLCYISPNSNQGLFGSVRAKTKEHAVLLKLKFG